MSPANNQSVYVNSALGVVGPTGSGKTSLIATAAEFLYDTYKQVLLLATADGGGYPTKVQSLVKVGVIRPWRMRTRGEAFETTMRASQGWWPSRINPATGETPPGVRLVPPMTERFEMLCAEGHLVKVVPFQSMLTPGLCPTCKKHVTKADMQVRRSAVRTKGFEQVGGMAFDGLTSFLSWQMSDMAGRHARMELKGEETAIGGRITSGDLVLGGNNRAHYGFVQSRAEEMVLNSIGIPALRLPPLWTMLLLETIDEGGLPVKGPKLAGKAKTDEAPAWFGNMLEIGIVKDDDGHDVRRLWLSEFIDDSNTRHLVKHRGGPAMPPYLQDPYGQPWSQVHLGLFFELLEKDVQDSAEAATARFQDAPGVAQEEFVEYGEAVVAQDAPVGGGATAGPGGPTTLPAASTAQAPAAAAVAPKPGGVKPGRVRAPKPAPVPSTPPPAEPVEAQQAEPPQQEVSDAQVAVGEVETVAPVAAEPPSTPAPTPAPAPAPRPVPAPRPAPAAPAAPVAAKPPQVVPPPRPAGMAPPPGPRPPARAPARPAPRPAPVPAGQK